jgi:hypothetical protein
MTKPKRPRRRVEHAVESMQRLDDGSWVHEFVLYVHDTMHDTLAVETFTRTPSPAEVAAFIELAPADEERELRP